MAKNRAILHIVLLLLVPVAWGQGDTVPAPTDAAPKPAEDAGPAYTVSDFRPPSGAQPFSLMSGGKKQLDISLFTTQSWDSSPPSGSPQNGDWSPATSFGGAMHLTLDKHSSMTTLDYNGHAIAYPDGNPTWLTYQNVNLTSNYKLGRWGLAVIDSFSYSPNSPFGGFGYGLPGGADNGGQSVLNPQYSTNQSILTGYSPNYSNNVTGQIEYGLSRRSSVTGSVGFGILRFPDVGLQNTNQVTASAGYSHSFTARDSMTLNYTFGGFVYTGYDYSYITHTIQAGYSHRLSGRFSFQLAGGPQFIDTTSLGVSDTRIQSSGSASLLYSKARTNLSLSYFRGTTSGSGVLTGATTQTVGFNFERELSKAFSASVAAGYAYNSGLVQQQSYKTVFVSPSLRRAIARNFGMTINYSYQHQIGAVTCVGIGCGTTSRNFVSVGIDYAFRPIRLE